MAIEWITPKTDWSANYNAEGIFTGDFFNVTDYNRIKNNLLCLRELGKQLIYNLPDIVVGQDKHYPDNENPDFDNDNFFADEINAIEDGLQMLDDYIGIFNHGTKQVFYENGKFIDYNELNRIESAQLELYVNILNSIAAKPRLPIRLGTQASTIRI